MKKLIISENQLKMLSNHILNNTEVIQEGFSDVTLGALYLIGVDLTGQNEAIGQRAINDPKIIKQIDDFMSNTDKLNNFIEKVEVRVPNIRDLIQNKLGDIEISSDN